MNNNILKYTIPLLIIPHLFCADINQSVKAKIKGTTDIEGVGFNNSDQGIEWSSASDMKSLKLTINGDNMKIKNSMVTTDGVQWLYDTDNPDENSKCSSSKDWKVSALQPDKSYHALFTGDACLEGKGEDQVKWVAGVVQVDLDVDADNNSTGGQSVPDGSAQEEYYEQAPNLNGNQSAGLLLCLNEGFDEGGAINVPPLKDFEIPGIVISDPNLVHAQLNFKFPDELLGNKARITFSSGIKVYAVSGSDSVLIPNEDIVIGNTIQINAGTLTQLGKMNNLLIEGVGVSSGLADANIKATLKTKSQGESIDEVKLTVVKVNIETPQKPNYTGPKCVAFNLPTIININITPPLHNAGYIEFEVIELNNGNGAASITLPANRKLSASGTITIRGNTQSDIGKGGNLKIQAKLNGNAICNKSNGFSVISHPKTIKFGNGVDLTPFGSGSNSRWGTAYTVSSLKSESGGPSSEYSSEMTHREKITIVSQSGFFVGISNQVGGYLPMTTEVVDLVGLLGSVSAIQSKMDTNPTGTIVNHQIFEFRDRCNYPAPEIFNDNKIKESGYKLEISVERTGLVFHDYFVKVRRTPIATQGVEPGEAMDVSLHTVEIQ